MVCGQDYIDGHANGVHHLDRSGIRAELSQFAVKLRQSA